MNQKEIYQKMIRAKFESLSNIDAAHREHIYEKFRKANESLIQRKGTDLTSTAANLLRSSLDDAIAEQEQIFLSEYTSREFDPNSKTSETNANSSLLLPSTLQAPSTKAVSSKRGFATGLLTGATAVALFAAAALASGIVVVAKPQNHAIANLERLYEKNLGQVDLATEYLQRVRDTVIARQKANGAELAALAGKTFIQLSQFDPELALSMPKTLPERSLISLRADATDYKILLNWPMCATVQISKPELIDPMRSSSSSIGCTGFGYWSKDAAQW